MVPLLMTGISDSFESRIAARRRNFKKASGDANDMRRRREVLCGGRCCPMVMAVSQDATVQIRKKEKEDQLVRRRRLGVETEEKTQADFKTPSKSATHVGLKEEGKHGSGSTLAVCDGAQISQR